MAVTMNGTPGKPAGVIINGANGPNGPTGVHGVGNEEQEHSTVISPKADEELNLYDVFNRVIGSIFSGNPDAIGTPFLGRVKDSVSESVPLLRHGLRNTSRDVLVWTQRGSAFRALLVLSVGTVTLLSLTGLLVFMLFFIMATANAIVISLLISLAVAGGFLAMFFACVTAIYIWALVIAGSVILTVTISTIIASFFAAGWIGFFWMAWLVAMKSASLAKRSLKQAGMSLPAYTFG